MPTIRVHMDIRGVNAAVGGLLLALLLMFVPLIISGSFERLMTYLMPTLAILGLLWFAFARGTYISVDESKKLYGMVFFVRGRTTPLSDVVSINSRKTYGGLMTEVYMMYRKNDGTLADRTIVNRESLRKNDLRKLMKAIRSANPRIEIARELLEE